MCKDYALNLDTGQLLAKLNAMKDWPDAVWEDQPHHFVPQTHIRIADKGLLVCLKRARLHLEVLPWAWEDRGHLLFNVSAENRAFISSCRCLIPATGFYRYTMAANPQGKQPDQHLFRLRGHEWFWIAGIIRHSAFAVLTAKAGPAISQLGQRQPCVFAPEAGLNWLKLSAPACDLLRPLPRKAFDISTLRKNGAVRPEHAVPHYGMSP